MILHSRRGQILQPSQSNLLIIPHSTYWSQCFYKNCFFGSLWVNYFLTSCSKFLLILCIGFTVKLDALLYSIFLVMAPGVNFKGRISGICWLQFVDTIFKVASSFLAQRHPKHPLGWVLMIQHPIATSLQSQHPHTMNTVIGWELHTYCLKRDEHSQIRSLHIVLNRENTTDSACNMM